MNQHIIISLISLNKYSLSNDIILEIIKNLSMRTEILKKYQHSKIISHNNLIYIFKYILSWYQSNNNWNISYSNSNNFGKWFFRIERPLIHPVEIAKKHPDTICKSHKKSFPICYV